MPNDAHILATTVVDSLVIAGPEARLAGAYYWEKARPATSAVVRAVEACGVPPVRAGGAAVLADPADPSSYAAMRRLLVEKSDDPEVRYLLQLGWVAACTSRLGYHSATADPGSFAKVSVGDLMSTTPSRTIAGATVTLIVIPFRDTSTGGDRMRNLLACLGSLSDQSASRDQYRVVVVETDTEPRWRSHVEHFADHYIFAYSNAPFNRSWGVNVGVMNYPSSFELICIMDGDILCDRDFVARNVERFRTPGVQGHLPYGNVLCLDPPTSHYAIRQRLLNGVGDVRPDELRGFLLRRPTGGCGWVRSEAFHRIGGMDERYEGWGGEDNDFAYRFDRYSAPLDRYHELLYHLHHPAAVELRADGDVVNGHIPAMTWDAMQEIGRTDRYAAVSA